jgi:hypothetical protein
MFLTESTTKEITAKVGKPCPKGGLWYPKDGAKEATYAIGIDNTMPPSPVDGGDTWILAIPSGTGK